MGWLGFAVVVFLYWNLLKLCFQVFSFFLASILVWPALDGAEDLRPVAQDFSGGGGGWKAKGGGVGLANERIKNWQRQRGRNEAVGAATGDWLVAARNRRPRPRSKNKGRPWRTFVTGPTNVSDRRHSGHWRRLPYPPPPPPPLHPAPSISPCGDIDHAVSSAADERPRVPLFFWTPIADTRPEYSRILSLDSDRRRPSYKTLSKASRRTEPYCDASTKNSISRF